jgi:cell division protein FtsQ
VANGYIFENMNIDVKKHVHVKQFNKEGKSNILSDLQELASYIHHDPFWNSQFVQVFVNKKGEIELIPRVGAHIIILGKADAYQNKLKKLKTFYVKGLNSIGWNDYETINLKYKNQVICSKR